MKRYLLDTHALLFWLSGGKKLGRAAFRLMEDPRNELLVSVVSTWEIGIKFALGKLKLPDSPERYLPAKFREHGFVLISLEHMEALAAAALPQHHDDPFDRALVAQSIARGAPIVSRDGAFEEYDVETIW